MLLSDSSTRGQADSRPLSSFHVGISWSTGGAGGSGRVFADLSRYLPLNGCGFAGAVASPVDVAEHTCGNTTNLFPPQSGALERLLHARTSILKRVDHLKPDVLASHFALYGFPILDKLRELPSVTHFHGPWSAESQAEGAGFLNRFIKRQLELSVYKRADRTIVLSEAFANVATQQYAIPSETIRIIPGSVDLDRFRPVITKAEARERLGWSSDRRVLLVVRRLVARMGLHSLIDAMQRIADREPDVMLYIAGRGRLQRQLEDQIQQRKLQKWVRLVGFVPDDQLPLMFQAADLSIVPTLVLEGFGLVAAESLAAGTPAIVTPVGGLPEVVRGLHPRLILPSASTEDLSAGVMEALDGGWQLPTREECLDYAEKYFNPNVMARRTAAVYRELL